MKKKRREETFARTQWFCSATCTIYSSLFPKCTHVVISVSPIRNSSRSSCNRTFPNTYVCVCVSVYEDYKWQRFTKNPVCTSPSQRIIYTWDNRSSQTPSNICILHSLVLFFFIHSGFFSTHSKVWVIANNVQLTRLLLHMFLARMCEILSYYLLHLLW